MPPTNDKHLHVIDLDHDLPGYRQFLSCWIARHPELTFIVDPGPMSSCDHLLARLASLDVERIDYVLLTHIHLDHAGATGRLLERYPEARVVCHERGTAHMIDPARLWEGSVAVLGDVARVYGAPPPVPASRLADAAEVERRGIRVIPTPGHAAHHLAFLHQGTLFAGEMAGTRHPLPGQDFMRPATPPRFILEVALDSFDRTLALRPEPQRMIFAHYGLVDDPAKYLRAAREQLVLWVETVRELNGQSPEDLQRRVHERLLRVDPWYGTFPRLPRDLQEREYHYMGQSLEGMLGYVRDQSDRR